jgi:hypothetical protein
MMQKQINSLNMYNAVLQFLNDNNAAWSANTIIAAAVTLFGSTVSTIQQQAAAQQSSSKKGYTTKKDQDLENLIDLTYKLALRVKNYAAGINNPVLKQGVDFSRHELQNGKEADILNRCINIISKANDVTVTAPAAYKITPELVAQATAAAELITPDTAERDVVSGSHSGATTQLSSLFITARIQLNTLDDLLEGDADEDSEFVRNYFIVRRTIDHTAGRKKETTDTATATNT